MELNWTSYFRLRGDVPEPTSPPPPGLTPPPPGLTPPPPGLTPPPPIGHSQEPDGPSNRSEGAPGPENDEPEREPRGDSWAWLRQVSFRSRVSVLVALAVGVAVAMAALVSYVAVSRQLERQATSNLQRSEASAAGLVRMSLGGPTISYPRLLAFQNQTGDSVQVITQTEVITLQPDQPADSRFFPMTPGAKQALAAGPNGNVPIETVTADDGSPYRVASVPTAIPGVVVQIGFPLTGIDGTLSFLRLILVLVALGGVAVATGLGWAVGRASMRPVEDLTLAAEHVADTQDLTATIDDTGNDELARLARSFNAMLSALSASKNQQAQLVSDAGHELRTPLTSLRTNIEVLMRTKDMNPTDRAELLRDVNAQLTELTTLVGDLVDLAREDERPQTEPEQVAFDQIVERAVERAQRRAMSVSFDVSIKQAQVLAQPALLERAIMNVLDNAAKWSPPGGHVGVNLETGKLVHLVVTDQGPGIAPEDLPHIFDRFYRARSARSMPGSGLGLAIVKNVITSHGGTIDVTTLDAGGTRVDILLPSPEPTSPDHDHYDSGPALDDSGPALDDSGPALDDSGPALDDGAVVPTSVSQNGQPVRG